MSVVSLKAVSSSKWGGQFWSKLKKTPESGPKWEKLKDSDIWTDKATYGHLHAFLAGRTQPVKSEAQHLTTAAVGRSPHNQCKSERSPRSSWWVHRLVS